MQIIQKVLDMMFCKDLMFFIDVMSFFLNAYCFFLLRLVKIPICYNILIKRKVGIFIMMNAIRDFYSDAMPHSNGELYKHFEELLGNGEGEKQRHILRGCQQTLKRSGELKNIGYGIWCGC